MQWIEYLGASVYWKKRVEICQEITQQATYKDAPLLIPILSDLLFDAKLQVKDAALEAIRSICDKLSNKDLEPLIPKLIDAMANPNSVEETIHALSATTFVQAINAGTLCILVPLLERGLCLRSKVVQRKACVIIQNMSKLVEDIEDVKVFLPRLLPQLHNISNNASDPDNRNAATKAILTIQQILAAALKIGLDTEELEKEDCEVLCDCQFSLAYGAKILLKNATMHLKRGKRYGLCGPNGIGKSTLLRAIANGQVDGFPNDILKTIYVEHDIDSDSSDNTVYDYIASTGVYESERIHQELEDKGFNDMMQQASIGSLSGGWKMKLALVKAMLQNPDILMLDEPTNHLDVSHVAWLEQYLCNLTNVTCIMVSHDSGFLDHVCTHIIHYIDFKLHFYRGNLTEFVKLHPEAASYYSLEESIMKFKFPEPGFLEGVKTKDKAILKGHGIYFTYPNTTREIISNANVSCSLNSRIAVLGPVSYTHLTLPTKA